MATLDRRTFRKEVASMRNEIDRIKTGLFQKLTRAAVKFKTKSTPEDKLEHYKQKAKQLIEEAAEGKMLDNHDITKFLLSHTEEELKQLYKDPNLQPDMKFKAKMGLQYPSLRNTINRFHSTYPAWKESLPDLLESYDHKPPLKKKVEKLKINNKAQKRVVKKDLSESLVNNKAQKRVVKEDLSESLINNKAQKRVVKEDLSVSLISDNGNNWSVTEDLDTTLVRNKKRMNVFDDNSKGMNPYGKKGRFIQRKPYSKIMDFKPKHVNTDFARNKRFNNHDKMPNKYFTKNNDFKYKKTLNYPKKDARSTSNGTDKSTNGEIEMMVDKTGTENQTKSDVTNLNETLPAKQNPSSDVEMKAEELKADSFFMTKDNKEYMSSSKVKLHESVKPEGNADNGLKSYRPKNFKNGNQKLPHFSDWKRFGNKFNKQQDYSNRFGQNKPRFNSRPTFKPGGNRYGSFKNNRNPQQIRSFKNNQNPQQTRSFKNKKNPQQTRNFKNNQSPQQTRYVKLHPSWEAKKKQVASITEFKGNKIVFN